MPDSKPSQVAFSGAQASQVPPPPPPAFNLVAGTTFGGRFKISRLIAHGGMGSVYLAHDANTGEEVALKLIRPELVATPDALERFLTEGKVARRLSHANIARVFDIDRKDGVWFIAMEFAKGVSLRQWMQSKRQASEPVSLDTALWVARRLLHALHHLHGLKVIHRDVKPENIIVDDPEGTAKTLKLVDFGLARKLNPDATRLTMSGAVVGTLGYMAPEQRSGGTVDARSDLYSVAVIVYELLTGVAFDGLWEPVSELRQDVRGGIDDWLRATLSKFPEKRPASAKAMLEALDYALAVQSQAPHVSAIETNHVPLARPSMFAVSVVPILLLLVATTMVAGVVAAIVAERTIPAVQSAAEDRRKAESFATAAAADRQKADQALAEARKERQAAQDAAEQSRAERELAELAATNAAEDRHLADLTAKVVAANKDLAVLEAQQAASDRAKAEQAASQAASDRAKAEQAAKQAATERAKAEQAALDAAKGKPSTQTPTQPPAPSGGTGYLNRDCWRKLEKGQTKDAVKKLLGEPIQVFVSGSFEYWLYDKKEYFDNGAKVRFFESSGVYDWAEPKWD